MVITRENFYNLRKSVLSNIYEEKRVILIYISDEFLHLITSRLF